MARVMEVSQDNSLMEPYSNDGDDTMQDHLDLDIWMPNPATVPSQEFTSHHRDNIEHSSSIEKIARTIRRLTSKRFLVPTMPLSLTVRLLDDQ